MTEPHLSAPDRERRLGDWARARLAPGLADLVMFVLKQGWAWLFGGLLLLAMVPTRLVRSEDRPVHRHDALLDFARVVQAAFLRFGLETWAGARVILFCHLTGTVMEWFKIAQGSWSSPRAFVTVTLVLRAPLSRETLVTRPQPGHADAAYHPAR